MRQDEHPSRIPAHCAGYVATACRLSEYEGFAQPGGHHQERGSVVVPGLRDSAQSLDLIWTGFALAHISLPCSVLGSLENTIAARRIADR
jgi:hypothetical protein